MTKTKKINLTNTEKQLQSSLKQGLFSPVSTYRYFTSESVTEGHPDKICDKISDAILDAVLAKDKNARVACEVTASTGLIHIMGEISTKANIDYQQVARDTLRKIGYDDSSKGFDYKTCAILVNIDEQSPDIAQGVNSSDEKEQGAGDQGMMFGYATNEVTTDNKYMPLAITLAHALTERLTAVRKSGLLSYLRPDGKAQVTVKYKENPNKKAKQKLIFDSIDTVVLSSQHAEDIKQEKVREDLITEVIIPTFYNFGIDTDSINFGRIFINPTGLFVIGGPMGDTGLTGRKIIVDTYGGKARHGGGAFSGKDASKVDRSAAYYARYVAKNLVAAGVADELEIQVSYAIGMAEPTSIEVNTFGTSKYSDKIIVELIKGLFDFRPASIIKQLKLKNPIYSPTASYGHFGRTPEDKTFTWEKLDKVDKIKRILSGFSN